MTHCNHEFELVDVIDKDGGLVEYIYYCRHCVAVKHDLVAFIESWINDDPNDEMEE